MSLFRKLQICLVIGISVLPIKVNLYIYGLEQFLPLIVGLQSVLVLIFISFCTDKELDNLCCCITFVISVVLSFFLGNFICDIVSIFTNVSIIELLNIVLNTAFLNANGNKFTLSMDIRELLNPVSGSQSSTGDNSQNITQSSSQATASNATASNATTNTPLDLSSNVTFGNSLESKSLQIAKTKPAGFSGEVSVTLRDLGIYKGSPEWNFLVNVIPKPNHDYVCFENSIHAKGYLGAVIWSTKQVGHSPGSSIIERIKNS